MQKVFSTVVAGAVAGLMVGGVAMAKDAKKKDAKAKKDKAGEGWCKSNECGGKVEGAKNECKGKMACQGVTKEKCETGGAGTWTTEAKPK